MTAALMKAAWYDAQGAARDVLRVGELPVPDLAFVHTVDLAAEVLRYNGSINTYASSENRPAVPTSSRVKFIFCLVFKKVNIQLTLFYLNVLLIWFLNFRRYFRLLLAQIGQLKYLALKIKEQQKCAACRALLIIH